VLETEALKASITRQPMKGFQIHMFPFLQVNKANNFFGTFPQDNILLCSTGNVSVLKTIPVNLHNQRLTVSYAVSINSDIVKEKHTKNEY